jgi:hypothetical protein
MTGTPKNRWLLRACLGFILGTLAGVVAAIVRYFQVFVNDKHVSIPEMLQVVGMIPMSIVVGIGAAVLGFGPSKL